MCDLCAGPVLTTPTACTYVAVEYTLMLEEERAAMGVPLRSFFEDSSSPSGTLKRAVMVPNNRATLCVNVTVLIHKTLSDRVDPFVVSLRVNGSSPTPPQTDGNQSITDLNMRPVVVTSGKQQVAVSAGSVNGMS